MCDVNNRKTQYRYKHKLIWITREVRGKNRHDNQGGVQRKRKTMPTRKKVFERSPYEDVIRIQARPRFCIRRRKQEKEKSTRWLDTYLLGGCGWSFRFFPTVEKRRRQNEDGSQVEKSKGRKTNSGNFPWEELLQGRDEVM